MPVRKKSLEPYKNLQNLKLMLDMIWSLRQPPKLVNSLKLSLCTDVHSPPPYGEKLFLQGRGEGTSVNRLSKTLVLFTVTDLFAVFSRISFEQKQQILEFLNDMFKKCFHFERILYIVNIE